LARLLQREGVTAGSDTVIAGSLLVGDVSADDSAGFLDHLRTLVEAQE
jgi:hypothetical protein